MASRIEDFYDVRSEPRDEVHYRARAHDAAGRATTMLVVNISPGGLMARCDDGHEPGAVVRVTVPVLGQVAGRVRWSLGGRIGCQFDRPIAPRDYRALLAVLPVG